MDRNITKSIHGKGWKRTTKISAEKYDIISKAILKVLTRDPVKFTELSEKIAKKVKDFPGSVGWYTVSVLRELETQDKIVRDQTKKPVTYYKK